MKKFLLLLCAISSTAAIGEEGYRGYTRYRKNDPFVLCTYGQLNPMRCWWPMDPTAPTHFENPDCDPPNTETGRPWSDDDWASLYDYEAICPKAKHTGRWTGEGTGEQIPMIH
ncbi:hypothetical protein JNG39_13880 [Luteibacter sp. CQ10]